MKKDPTVKSASKRLAFIAPRRLHDAFAVFFRSSPTITLLATASTVDNLVARVGEGEPDLVLLYAADSVSDKQQLSLAGLQIAQIKTIWPLALRVAIISYPASKAERRKLGADVTLFEGIAPDRLLAILNALEPPQSLSNHCDSSSELFVHKPFHTTIDEGGQEHET